jgi:hypothetical protein
MRCSRDAGLITFCFVEIAKTSVASALVAGA